MPLVSGTPSDNAAKLAQAKRFANTVTGLLVGIGFTFLGLFAWATACDGKPGIPMARILGLGGILAGGAFTIGSLLGLLFGIPRTSDTAAVKGQWVANTNLIQISDWLTKVLVGVSLTTLFKVPDLLGQFGRSYGAELGSPSMAIGLLLHFSVSGFICGYLMTRLVLQQAFHHADQYPEGSSKDDPSGNPDDTLTEPEDLPTPDKPTPTELEGEQ